MFGKKEVSEDDNEDEQDGAKENKFKLDEEMDDSNNADWLKSLKNVPSSAPPTEVQPPSLFAHPSRGLAAPKRDESTKVLSHVIPQKVY